jgi:hypothetical protein
MKTNIKLFGIMALLAIFTIGFIACDNNNGDDKKDPPKPQNGTITFRDKSITVDYSNSGLTQAQADTVTPKLQSIFTNFATADPSSTEGIKFSTMVNRPRFKIVIIPGNSGCLRSGDNMTLGADFVLTNDVTDIGRSIGPAILNNNLFADPPTPCLCPEGTTHEPDDQCCEGTDCNCQIEKTYTITLKDGALEFTVEYKTLPTDEEPAYLAYLKTRLETFMNSQSSPNVGAVDLLLTKGNSFNIEVEYAGASYSGLVWNTAKQAFTVHNDWISTASGVTGDNALTLAIMRDAFISVKAE